MTKGQPHISVCICTFKRPDLLKRLLELLGDQASEGLFTYSLVVVDNDAMESARAVVAEVTKHLAVALEYHVQPIQNIALTRNKAVQSAKGELLAFIDDDEFPARDWLLTLFQALHKYEASGVLGPVKPHFDEDAPKWIIDGGFYDRSAYPSGLVLDWSKCRTGNVLVKGSVLSDESQPFDPKFLTGEDQDFFRRMIAKGHTFVWCHEAAVFETVPPIRWRRSFLVKRALLRGGFSLRTHGASLLPIAESLLAAPLYAAMLPLSLLWGQAKFMSCVFRCSYHTGRLLALLGINPIRGPYVTE